MALDHPFFYDICVKQRRRKMKVWLCLFLLALTWVFLAGPGAVCSGENSARKSIPHPPAPYVKPDEPVTKTLPQAEAAALLESDWLFEADDTPTIERIRDEIRWARELASRLARNATPPDLKSELRAIEELEKRTGRLKNHGSDSRTQELYCAVRRIKRRIMFKNPAVDFSRVIFIDNPYPKGSEWKHQARHRNARHDIATA
jgi:hypothetical protein